MSNHPQFPSQYKDEKVLFKLRRHWLILELRLIPPFLLLFVTTGVGLGLGLTLPLSKPVWAGITFLLALGPLALAIWRFLNWENDQYILTDQRVLHIERVYFLFESREEVPLGRIREVTVELPSLIANLGYFGNVVIRTSAPEGQIRFNSVPKPHRAQRFILRASGLPIWASDVRRTLRPTELLSHVFSWEQAKRGIDRADGTPDGHIETLATHIAKAIAAPSPSFKALSPLACCYVLDITQSIGQLRLPKELPLIFILSDQLTENELESIRELLTIQDVFNRRIALLVTFDPMDDVDRARELLDQRIKFPYAFDIVTLRRHDFLNLVAASNPRHHLRRLLLKHVDLVSVSPFVTTGAALDNMFFGREKELREITDHAATSSYALIGGRRIGKTSILKRLERVRLPTVGFHALYHDCSFTPMQGELVQAVTADKSWFPEPSTTPPTSFANVIQVLPDDKPVVILLDEADKLVEPDRQAGYPLFNTVRAMANAGRCRFVLSGERALRTELTNPSSPLYNFANEILIGRLDFRAVEELVTRPMKQLEIVLEDEAEMVQRIWDFTSGHPNVVQRLCQRLIVLLNQRGDRRLTLDDVEAVVVDPDFLRKDFLNIYWERATALERLCSLVMAADDSVRTLTVVHETLDRHDIRTTLNEVDDALERLVDLRNILRRTPAGYEFAVTAFPEVIAKTARLEDLIALNRETYQHYGDVEPRSKRGSP